MSLLGQRLFQGRIEEHLARIAAFLGPEYKLTLVARYTGRQFSDVDILLTDDDPVKALETITRMKDRPSV